MIKVRRTRDRHRLRSGGQHLWLSFYPSREGDALAHGFGALVTLNEGRLPPEGNMLTYSRGGSELLTYVIEGTLLYQASGRPSLLRAGDFQRSSVQHSDHLSYMNASEKVDLHVVQFCLLGSREATCRREPERSSFPQRNLGQSFCLVASGDGRQGSLSLHRDTSIFSCMLRAAQTVVHPLLPGRMAWLQVLKGEVELGDTLLLPGDGAGVSHADHLLLKARTDAEAMLVDLEDPLRPVRSESAKIDRLSAVA